MACRLSLLVAFIAALGLGVGAVGCSPLYGSKPEKLKNPEKKKRPPEAVEAAPEVKYVDDCPTNFTDDPKKAQKQTTMSRQLFEAGETTMDQSDKAKEDSMKVSLMKEAIEKYRNALVKDPYNVPATLKLAVAYDRVLRKGCAIAMLKRLAALSNNPSWQSEANRNIDSIDAAQARAFLGRYDGQAVAAAFREIWVARSARSNTYDCRCTHPRGRAARRRIRSVHDDRLSWRAGGGRLLPRLPVAMRLLPEPASPAGARCMGARLRRDSRFDRKPARSPRRCRVLGRRADGASGARTGHSRRAG